MLGDRVGRTPVRQGCTRRVAGGREMLRVQLRLWVPWVRGPVRSGEGSPLSEDTRLGLVPGGA